MLREELDQILKDKPRKDQIDRAINLENKTRFFVEPSENSDNAGAYKNDFLRIVKGRLNNFDSYNNFLNNLSFPLKINEFIDDIFSRLAKIWQGQNPYYDYSFKKGVDDYHKFVDLDFFKTDAWEYFKGNYNSIILTDLPQEQTTTLPEPFNIFISISSVIDVLSIKNKIKHLIFSVGDDKIAVIDSESYQLWKYKDELLSQEFEYESKHKLKRCPAVWLSQKNFNSKSDIVKANPLSKSLGKIEDLQIIYTLKNIISPYAFYQFIVKFKTDSQCTYDNGKHYCVGGYLQYVGTNTSVMVGDNALAKCPQCNKQPGVGDVIAKPIPVSSDEPQLNNVIEFVAPDTEIMKYGDEYIKSLESDLFNNIIGTDDDLNPNENHNETAYKYNVEGQQDVIFKWKEQFEKVISDVHDNVLELAYAEKYKGNTINLGTDFILANVNNLYEEKERLDKLGLSVPFDFNKTIINAKYHNNPDKKRRALVINQFKPFDEGITQVEQSAKDELIDRKDYIKQKYLSQFIREFETKKVNINDFDQDVSVSKIVDAMNTYFDEWYNAKFNNNQKTIE